MTLAEGYLVHKNVSYERLSLIIPLTYGRFRAFILRHLAYIWQVNLRKSPFGGMFWVIFPTKAAIYKRDITVRTLKSAIYKRDSGAAREEVAVIAETIAIFRGSFSYNRNYRDFE